MADAATAATWTSGLEGLALPSRPGVAQLAGVHVAGRLVLRTQPEAAQTLLAAGGLEAPTGINRVASNAAGACLQLGPDEWLILWASGTSASATAAQLATAAAGAPHAPIDVGDRSVGLTLSGPRVEDVLAAACPLPLDLEAFAIGRATRTLLGKAEIVLWRQAVDRFHIEVARSFAPYVVALLARSMATEAALAAQTPA